MAKKATYNEPEQRVKVLEKELRECRKGVSALKDGAERLHLFHEACSAGMAKSRRVLAVVIPVLIYILTGVQVVRADYSKAVLRQAVDLYTGVAGRKDEPAAKK
ncbi:MAG: hypothetical protein DRJ13_15210, partial [Bacteroidetes bacterium]